MKIASPRDQETRDKEGPVCSEQHQTEPVASFVPPKPFHHKAHSLILLLLLFAHPPTLFPPQKEPAWPPTYTIQAQCHSKPSTRSSPFSCSYSHLFSSCFPSVTCQYNVEGVEICPSPQHVNTQVVWASGEEICVFTVGSFENRTTNKNLFMLTQGGQTGNRLQSALWPLRD